MSHPSHYHLVEGEWNNSLIFRRIDPKDHPLVKHHLQTYFFKDEPSYALFEYTEEFGDEIWAMVEIMLTDGLSFLAEDKETKELAGLRITYRSTPQNKDRFSSIPIQSYAGKELFRLSEEAAKVANLFERYEVSQIARFFAASTAPRYRKIGLASEFYRRSLAFLKAQGFSLAVSLFTSPFTRKAARNLGFQEVCRVNYAEIMKLEESKVKSLGEEEYGAVMAKRF